MYNTLTLDERRALVSDIADDLFGEVPMSFEHMDDLAEYTLRRDGILTARKVA